MFARRSNKPTVTTRFGSKKILPDNSEFTANPEHGRTLFARQSNKPTATTRFGSKKFSPTILNLQQILSTGEHRSLVEVISPRQQHFDIETKLSHRTPTIQNLQQILSTGERCSPLQWFGIGSTVAKSLRSVQGAQLWSALLIPHSSLNTAPPLHSPTL